MSDLLPCPFCGNEDIKLRSIAEYPYGNRFTLQTGHVASCDKCNLDMNMADRQALIDRWNTRKGSAWNENIKLFLTSWPNGTLRPVEVLEERKDQKGYFYIRYIEGRRAGGTDTTSSEFLYDLPSPPEQSHD